MSCTSFRSVDARIAWFLSHKPSGVGMCAQHTWHSLGGNKSPACPPRWYATNANQLYDKAIASGRFWKGDPPKGAIVLWKYGKYGHAALSLGGGKIATTDPDGKPGGVGIESILYPHKWGATLANRIWTDSYAGVKVGVEKESTMGVEYHYGGKPSTQQVVKTKYVDLDRSAWNPLRKGLEHAMIYLNVTKPKFKTGKTIGAIRVRCIRENTNDKTGYHDYIIHIDANDGTSQLITHPYFEDGDGGPTKWQVKCIGGLAEVTLDTRHRKGAVVYG